LRRRRLHEAVTAAADGPSFNQGRSKRRRSDARALDIRRKESTMTPRIDHRKVEPGVMRAMLALQHVVDESGLEPSLLGLVEVRASQINGCAYCIDMHTKDARARGETEQRLFLLDAWRESPFYSPRERAALAWTEAVTRVADGHVPDDVFEQARAVFDESELVKLTLAIVTINSWNRLSISFRAVPGAYKAGARTATVAAAT
jgi:AhpD family alkylhydroperoxidase